MTSITISDESVQITRITWIGMIGNLGLSILKLAVGYLIGSLALIADGFHSLSDLVTDFAVLIGAAIAARPADKSHPFGHGKFETFAVIVVAIALVVVGGSIAWKAITSFGQHHETISGQWIIIVALISLVTKEWLFRATRVVADRCRSSALRANAWHHRSDALSSFVVLTGGCATMLGWGFGDNLAGLLVGLMVLVVGGKLGFEALIELSEGSAGKETINRINEVIAGFEEVRDAHRLRVRRVGRELIMDIHIVLDPHLTIKEGHNIVSRVESAVQEGIDWPISLTIHVDPGNAGQS